MVFDQSASQKVLGCLMKCPQLLASDEWPIDVRDFAKREYKILFSAIYNTFVNGSKTITPTDVEAYINQNPSQSKEYRDNNWVAILNDSYNNSDENNYAYYYNIVKKNALLNDFSKAGIDISSIYDPTLPEKDFANQISKLNAMTIKDILDKFDIRLQKIAEHYETFVEKSCIKAGEGIDDLLNSLQERPEIGMPLIGDITNTVTRGARLRKLYLDSSPSGVGKSRRMAGNAAHLAIPEYYDTNKNEWVNTGLNENVLFITTELEFPELQTLFLAYISGVDEAKILDNSYDTKEEKERVRYAAELLKKHNENLLIEYVPDPSIEGITTKIKLHALQNDVEYVFYDYIHVSSSTYTSKKEMRDDIWLMLFADKLKQLANDLNIHISSATQLNGAFEEKEIKNQNLLRGSKAIADKADIGFITMRVTTEGEKALADILSQKLRTPVPNFITDIYKNRRGKLTNLRIWKYVDLGTCRSIDCFITDQKGEPVEINNITVKVEQIAEMGGFAIVDKDTNEIILENRRNVEIDEF